MGNENSKQELTNLRLKTSLSLLDNYIGQKMPVMTPILKTRRHEYIYKVTLLLLYDSQPVVELNSNPLVLFL